MRKKNYKECRINIVLQGKVVRVAPDRVVVRFTVIGEKTFIVPTAFEKGFLKLG
ncbi:MAG: hypothetical protein IJ252_09715 [Solobacterium sp.]|nr:hypothetical protein [Solobacterium sp.]